jgi:hypothetical protein
MSIPAEAVTGQMTAQTARSATQPTNGLDRFLDKLLAVLRLHLPYTPVADRLYHRLLFFRKHHRWPGRALLWNDVLYRIKTSNEILDPLRVFVSDKEHVKQYVKAVVGDQHNVPTLAVLRTAAEVDAYAFPARCCIKPTHASARVILRRNGEPIDRDEIKRWFALNYYRAGREINYRLLNPKVIVEPLIFDSTNVDDYKVFCYRGEPRFVQLDFDRHSNHTRKIFDTRWKEQDWSIIYPRNPNRVPPPASLPKMLEVARALSAQFSFVRIDLYSDGNQVLVGEITNCSANAGGFFLPRSAEKTASERMFG